MHCATCSAPLAPGDACPRCQAPVGQGADYLEMADGRRVPLDKETVTLGRVSGNDLVLADSAISRRHARLQRLPHGWLLIDLNSANGTSVNGDPIVGPYLLQDGDSISVGDQQLTFHVGSGPPPVATPRPRLQAETVLGRAAFDLPPVAPPATPASAPPDEYPTGGTRPA